MLPINNGEGFFQGVLTILAMAIVTMSVHRGSKMPHFAVTGDIIINLHRRSLINLVESEIHHQTALEVQSYFILLHFMA